MKSKRGFTLIELLIVVLIIGILASIAIPRMTTVAEKARIAEATHIIGAIRSAEESYAVFHQGAYTTVVTDLDVQLPAAFKFFVNPPVITVAAPNYHVTMTRLVVAGSVYSGATVEFDSGTNDWTSVAGGGGTAYPDDWLP